MEPKTLISISDTQVLIRNLKLQNKKIGLVPTMGALHEGHLSLVKKAKENADVVIVSIFVNPTQFGPTEDFAKYPRTLANDLRLLEALDVDYVFAPTANEMYPGEFQTWVNNDDVSKQLCGLSRPSHFRGVCTIVLKLFNIIQPDFAIFGKKDYQQLSVLKTMARDLNLPVKIFGAEIVRNPDGLALSSRNKYLSDENRQTALLIYQSLHLVKEKFAKGERNVEELRNIFVENIQPNELIELEYCEIRSQDFLSEFEDAIIAPSVMLVAVRLAGVRLIDNFELGNYEFV